MKNFNVSCKIDYWNPYIPPRCRKTRYEEKEETIKVPVRSITSEEAPIAFRLSDYGHVSENTPEIRYYKGKFFKKYRGYDGHKWYVDAKASELEHMIHPWFSYDCAERTRALCIQKYKEEAKRYLLIDGVIWERTGEPRYVVNTFGLGHNHGGTGLFVDHWYNPNIANRNYFSALDGKKAVDYANQVAARRGDTNSVGTFKEMIEVLMPQCVKIKPMKEHGTGCKVINDLNAIADCSSDISEARILTFAYAACRL